MSDKLSQEDIDKMLKGNAVSNNIPSEKSVSKSKGFIKNLDEREVDTMGEICNISLGSAATSLSMLLGNRVEITTPTVTEYDKIEDMLEFSKDLVTVEIKYKKGLEGFSVFLLETKDTAIIADLMMGGNGKVRDVEIGELQLSAVGEAMNQMMGTSSTTLSSMFNSKIDITPPIIKYQKFGEDLDLTTDIQDTPIVVVSFKLIVGDLINSEMLQIMPLDAAKDQISRLVDSMNDIIKDSVSSAPNKAQSSQLNQNMVSYDIPAKARKEIPEPDKPPVTVQPVQFSSFNDSSNVYGESGRNLDLLMDVKLKLTVELGRAELSIKKVLELTRGSIVELEKVAGEPVELFANGKLIAKGEVVVIEDNFGLRITNIVSPDNRIKNL